MEATLGPPSAHEPPPRAAGHSRPLIWLVVLVVVLAAALGTVFTLGYLLPAQVAVVSQGQFELRVPLMMVYTAPTLPGAVENSTASVLFASTSTGGSTTFQYSWSLASSAPLPVEFSIRIPPSLSTNFVPLARGSFNYLPEGVCSGGCTRKSTEFSTSGPGAPYAFGLIWTFNYTVRLMSRFEGLGNAEFLEVDLNPVNGGFGVYGSPDDLATSVPQAADLLLLQTFGLLGSGLTVGLSTNDSAIHGRSFGYSPAPVAIDGGDQGTLSIRLTSAFRWSSVDWEELSLTSAGNVTVREYADLRFGSINVTVGPYAGP